MRVLAWLVAYGSLALASLTWLAEWLDARVSHPGTRPRG